MLVRTLLPRTLQAALVAVALLFAAMPAHAQRLKIAGRVRLGGRKPPPGRRVRVQLSVDFPGAGGEPDRTVEAKGGRFAFDKVKPGNYWLVAYVDDDEDGKLVPGKDIMGYSTVNPIPIGDGRSSFSATIDLDPILVQLVTRFVPASGGKPARRVLESMRVAPLDPRTGKFLEDAEVFMSQKKIELAPGGGWFAYEPDPPEEAQSRYIVEVMHAAYGRTARKHIVAPRDFGAVPEPRLVEHEIEWTSPPWANVSLVRAMTPNGKVVFDGATHSPYAWPQLASGGKVRVRVGRVDVQHPSDITIALGDAMVQVPVQAAQAPPAPQAPSVPPPAPP